MPLEAFPWNASTSVYDQNSTAEAVVAATTEGDVANMVAAAVAQTLGHSRPSAFVVWSTGLLFVTLINLCAVVGIGVMRYLSKEAYNQIITLFVGLGVGSLSGSSFYHLLPQAHPALIEEVDADGNRTHSYLWMAHFSLLGVYMFFMCDKIIKIVLESRKKNRSSHIVHEDPIRNDSHALLTGHCENGHKDHHASDKADIEMMKLVSNAQKSMGDQAHGVCVHDHSVAFQAGDSAIAAVAWMIIFGDGFHNFIDGISIGASFAESLHSGVSVSLAVLCEEFPHELGDVAILVASGMTLRQALLYNLLSAITCYVGFGIGVGIGELGPDVAKYAFALAGGMFLYISLGCMMPEMKKAMEEGLNVSLWEGLKVLILQVIGLILGLSLMFIMARYGEDIAI